MEGGKLSLACGILLVLVCSTLCEEINEDWDVCKARIFQEDIALTARDLRLRGRRTRRAATAFKNRRWRDGEIPYEIDTTFTGEQKALIRQAMRHWENFTCLTFIERVNQKDHIFFHKGDCGCCSYVGRKGTGRQGISIGKNCDKFGIIVHELGHVVGFWHEHTRPDRDGNVKIIKENIKAGEEHNFVKLTTNEVNSLNEPYDFGSIMHYARNTFSKDGYQSTIIPRRNPSTNYRPDIGQRLRLSKGDINQAKKMYKCHKCGRTFQEKSGDFSSPGFPEKYAINQDCVWRLSVTPGEKIVLNFTSFEIEHSDDCDYDHVEVRDGHSKNSPLIGRFCGKERPPIIWSSESRLWINFKSDATVYAPGFQAHYEAVCGGLIEKERGEIQSPNYPSYYEAKKKCIWTVTVPEGKQVGLKFLSFDVESGYDCLYDYVEIIDGGDTKAKSLGKFCGRNTPNDIKSSSRQITIKFVTDNSINKPGFALSFFSEVDECQNNNGGCEQLCVNTLGGYHCECKPGFEIHSNGKDCESACGGQLTANSGNISSPSYPDHYPKKKQCVWQIIVPKGSQISLKFHDFELEGSEVCRYDYVNITSGMERKMVGKYCGSTVSDVITSDSNVMWIEFRSDHSVSRRGFSASYYADLDECKINNGNCHSKCINTVGSYRCACGFGYKLHSDKHSCKEAGNCNVVLTAPSEELMSPNFPGIYPSNKECLWRISVTQGHRIKLTFEKFEMEEATVQNCSYDFVEVYSGYGRKPDLLGRFCGNKPPPSLISSTHRMMVKFKSDDHVGRSGFRASYTTVCGVNLHAVDHLKSFYSHPAYGDDNYERSMHCIWQIKAKPGYVIELVFTEFDVEKESICGYDYVKIHNGQDMSAPLLGQVCGNSPPSKFTSTSNFMWIEFFTDETTNRKGFIAEYKRVRIRKDAD